MRLAIVAAVSIAALAGTGPSLAQPIYPWCLKADMGSGAMVDFCEFATFERCAQERFRWGTTSFCILNPQHYFRQGPQERRPSSAPRRGER